MTSKYGVAYGYAAGTIERSAGLFSAHRHAIDLAVSGQAANVVELERDGEVLAATPAWRRILAHYSIEDGRLWAAGDNR